MSDANLPVRHWLVIAGLCCILGPSLGMLAATYYNRVGRPQSLLRLTQRELRLPAADLASAEPQALTFQLKWRVEDAEHADFDAGQPPSTPVTWMSREKRASLGVNSAQDLRSRSAVPAFLVLEFDGPAYARQLARACRSASSKACTWARTQDSRLYVVDAGSDAPALRARYPAPAMYAVVHGVVTFSGTSPDAEPVAYIGSLDVETIQATEPLRSARGAAFGEMSWRQLSDGRPFSADIAFGRRHEPWNLAISLAP